MLKTSLQTSLQRSLQRFQALRISTTDAQASGEFVKTTSTETAILPTGGALHSIPDPLPQEDQARADMYALIANLLLRPPDESLLAALAGADSLHSLQADNPLDHAWEQLILAASLTAAEPVRDEFDALFISVGTPLINPYGSRYVAGFMMEKPLAALRDELAALGLGRRPGVGEPEDHLGALCEVMRIMIIGAPGVPRRAVDAQRSFFIRQMAPWYSRCLDDIRNAEGVSFYLRVADFAQAFFELEFQAFEMEDSVEAA